MWALGNMTGSGLWSFLSPCQYNAGFWSMVSSELCFPTKTSGMIHQGVWNIFKIPLLPFSHSQRGCAFFLAWSCLLLRIRSLSSCDSLPLFGMWCHQESQLFQSESLPLPSCSLVDCVESRNVCSNTERKGNVKKQRVRSHSRSL